jgi:hypothetical protein
MGDPVMVGQLHVRVLVFFGCRLHLGTAQPGAYGQEPGTRGLVFCKSREYRAAFRLLIGIGTGRGPRGTPAIFLFLVPARSRI